MKQFIIISFVAFILQKTSFAELNHNPRYTYGQSVSCGKYGSVSRPDQPPMIELPSGNKGPVQALGLRSYSARFTEAQQIEISIGLGMRSCLKDNVTGEEFFYTELADEKDYLLLKAYRSTFSDVRFRQTFTNLARVNMHTGAVTQTPTANFIIELNQLLNSKMKAAYDRGELVQINLTAHYGFENFESEVRAYFPYGDNRSRVYEEDLSKSYTYLAFHGLKLSLQKNQVKIESIKTK